MALSPVARNRLLAVAALAVAGLGLAFVAMGDLGKNLVYYWSPKELVEQGENAVGPTIRLGGVVVPGSIQWNPDGTELRFKVANGLEPEAPAVLVSTREIPPQMFREKIGVVVEGTYSETKVFSSNRLMVNHSNEYRAPKNEQEFKQMVEEMEKQAATTPMPPPATGGSMP